MHSSALALLPVLLATAAPADVTVADPTGCVSEPGLESALAAALPPALADLPAGLFVIEVLVQARADDASVPEQVVLRARWATGEPLLDRTVPVVVADCPEVPHLLAVILARRLSDLPSQEFEKRRPPPPPPPPTPVAWRLGVGLGGTLGADAPLHAGHLEVVSSFGQPDGIRGVAGLRVSPAAPIGVGDGEAQLTLAVVELGASWDVALGPVRLVPAATLAGGFLVAMGLGFDEDERTRALPALRAGGELAVHSDLGLYGAVGATVGLVRGQLSDSATGRSTLEPLVRVHLTLGWAWSGAL